MTNEMHELLEVCKNLMSKYDGFAVVTYQDICKLRVAIAKAEGR